MYLVSTNVGAPKLEANVVVPNSIGYHIPATIYVDFSNTGDVAMPAPIRDQM